jgi:F420-non-reducing hydrogenase small subunit
VTKVQVSFEWLSGCSGCEMSTVDLHDRLLEVLDDIELVRIPILMDEKNYPKADLGIVTGALRTDHDVHAAHAMRESCEKILAFGVCAVYGGPQGSGYAHPPGDLEKGVFQSNPTTRTSFIPDDGVPVVLPEGVRPIDSEIEVDLYLPGCPPHPYYVAQALKAVLAGTTPEFGAHNVCFRCNRSMQHSEVVALRRSHDGPIAPEQCFLSQGILCMGSVTLDRCLAPCPQNGVACSGCAGPSENVILEPQLDIRTEIAERMSRMTRIPKNDIVHAIERQSKTLYAYAMASPVFRQKPTFLLRRWLESKES